MLARRRAPAAALLAALPLALAGALLTAAASSARADSYPDCPPGSTPNPIVKQCIITVGTSSSAPAPTGGGGNGGGAPAGCTFEGASIPCQNSYGYWDPGIQCYTAFKDPQPPAGDPAWAGHQPGDGSIWTVSCPNAGWPKAGAFITVSAQWFATPPAGPDPAALAAQASARMTMRAPAIATAPKSGATALVGAPVWVWDDKSAETWGPQSVTVAAGGLSVTATARVTDVLWDFGDGTVPLDCPTGGTPYQAAFGAAASPDCGHLYTASSATRPDGRYTLTATNLWTLSWAATDGERGTLTFRLTDTVSLPVGEAQAVVQGGAR